MNTLTSTRRKVAEGIYCNIYRNGRKVVGTIYEPCRITNYKFSVTINVAPGYVLKGTADSLPDAVELFDKLTDGKYQWN